MQSPHAIRTRCAPPTASPATPPRLSRFRAWRATRSGKQHTLDDEYARAKWSVFSDPSSRRVFDTTGPRAYAASGRFRDYANHGPAKGEMQPDATYVHTISARFRVDIGRYWCDICRQREEIKLAHDGAMRVKTLDRVCTRCDALSGTIMHRPCGETRWQSVTIPNGALVNNSQSLRGSWCSLWIDNNRRR